MSAVVVVKPMQHKPVVNCVTLDSMQHARAHANNAGQAKFQHFQALVSAMSAA